eukprot:1655953-Alexandrium_andersonii.AAC.1
MRGPGVLTSASRGSLSVAAANTLLGAWELPGPPVSRGPGSPLASGRMRARSATRQLPLSILRLGRTPTWART